MLEMPKLRPVPIRTKEVVYFKALWRWFYSIRQETVLEEWPFLLPDETKIHIPEGFEFDGTSIPRPFWVMLSPVGLLLIPGLIHDYAYKYDKLLTRNEEDFEVSYNKNAERRFWDRFSRDVAIDVNSFIK